MISVRITDIIIGPRFRKQTVDIEKLAESIKELGLLHPIVITEDKKLIAGQRRLEACKALGWTDISATIVNISDIKKGEAHENITRQEFTVSEMVEANHQILVLHGVWLI